MSLKKTLTLAGSDTSGGAGIQADLKTFQEHGTYGMTALTSIVAMDPNEGWKHNVFPIEANIVDKQLECAFSVGLDAMKTGMLGSVEIVQLGAKYIDQYSLKNVVIDPVMVCKGEDEVLLPETVDASRELLLPRALVTTPNLFEAWQLSKVGPIKTVADMKKAAEKIHALGAKNVVIKGGKALDHEKAVDLFYDGKEYVLLETEKIDTTYNHGAGCTFAAAITANLAKGEEVFTAVLKAKQFVAAAIRHGWKLNDFVGPVMHGAYNLFKDDVSDINQVTV
ncbi:MULTISPECIES: pyridoxine/pyridoxal/pyridoxamine kinase [Bacillaceae]|mgnify:FL=1|jgi:pyridoxine kinase|uniref:pyridoxal kinase n=1 Tax=Caldifermentibacillus hisashii TaxID=996558 RepID=A0ABU9JVX1_9BACI|nr:MULTISPECIES: pyridoxine/pyridoxal/pyridoxamine kinase [Bacillaceae]NWN98030.1 pyridoxine/pyridoxal/pyridoxamine kinase [Bacillus sp. (in: firmicutes)]KIO65391.1 Hydroxymethylpyrimidine phosphate kinase ThiD [Caldibacillus thermoamylovorans]KIO65435.1 Hydroxymethylpyrimidine phosphate kinase ThiD [Caldibacillus thermoamylovorans]MCM3054563.1 pyridoxine/pyridoxal/pyridoxamine kinase [Caldibacillus thermoamylovorans]MCM3477995.1 pyridoxine/pyridoxal/pyridoxamine kinase [Caldibacillus thermoam